MAKRVTIIDVAKLAGVDNSTVSLALRSDPRIRPETRERVRRAAAKLNYLPNHLARSLQGGRTKVLGVLLTDMHPFYSPAMEEFNAAADAAGCTLHVKFYGWDAARERQFVGQFCESRVDGLVWVPSDRSTPEFAELVSKMRATMVPFVALGLTDRKTHALPFHEVGVSTGESVRLAVDYLARHGHRRVAVATASQVAGQRGELHRNRLRLIREALDEAGLTPRPQDVLETRDNEYGGVTLAGEIARRPAADRPTAVFAADDMLARSVVASLHCLGVAIPDQISVIGYDDAPGDVDGPVPITTVSLKTREVAQQAMRLLLDLIEQRVPPEPCRSIAIVPELVERASVGPASA